MLIVERDSAAAALAPAMRATAITVVPSVDQLLGFGSRFDPRSFSASLRVA